MSCEGIQVLPATGRVKSGIPEYLTQIEGMRYVILSNGASVLDLKEVKFFIRIVFRGREHWSYSMC